MASRGDEFSGSHGQAFRAGQTTGQAQASIKKFNVFYLYVPFK